MHNYLMSSSSSIQTSTVRRFRVFLLLLPPTDPMKAAIGAEAEELIYIHSLRERFKIQNSNALPKDLLLSRERRKFLKIRLVFTRENKKIPKNIREERERERRR